MVFITSSGSLAQQEEEFLRPVVEGNAAKEQSQTHARTTARRGSNKTRLSGLYMANMKGPIRTLLREATKRKGESD